MSFTLISNVTSWLILLGMAVVVYYVIRQQGRMLLRLDQVEQRLVNPTAANANARNARFAGPGGLAVGTAFPPFELPDVTGQLVRLEQFLGKQVLLIHWSPGCGFCVQIASGLAGLQPQLAAQGIQLLLVSHGSRDANLDLANTHGLTCPILLQGADAPAVPAFEHLGTPVAYLLNTRGQVSEPLAVGADNVPTLAQKAIQGPAKRLPGELALTASRIERNGLKPGTAAPPFELPDLEGRLISLASYRGRRVLLIFSDPHCGPCDQLAPHLVRLDQQHRANGMALIMIGRGEPEDNRRKAAQHGFAFPVVLQRSWELSRAYGIFATPVAFLIDENGVIARPVGAGETGILALATESSAQVS